MKVVTACFAIALGLAPAGAPAAIEFPPCHGPTVANVPAVTETGDQDLIVLSAILLENESAGGSVAYCLSDAKMTNNLNGLSFGSFQYDLAVNERALPILTRHLTVARAADPSLQLTEADIATIQAGALSRTAHDLRQSDDAELPALIARVNAALSSRSAKAAIDREYADRLKKIVADLNDRIDALSDEVGARTYLRGNSLGRMLLLDYENFFGEMGEQFKSFLAGEQQTLKGGGVDIDGAASFTDIMNFALATKQGSGSARDQRAEVLRRMNNVVKHHGGGSESLSDRDRAYLTAKLKPIIDDTSNRWIKNKRQRGEYNALAELVRRAETR